MSTAPVTLTDLAERLRALPPSCGPVRLIGVDGHAGSGKSTLADRLARKLGGAPVVRLDELADHDSFFGWTERLQREVLDALARGEPARQSVYDWNRRARTGHRTLAPAPVVLVEGVGAGRRAVRPRLAHLLWMDLPPTHSWARGRARDGTALTAFWDAWTRAEREHFATDPSRPHAHLLVRGRPEPPPGPGEPPGPVEGDGYTVLPGPATRKRTTP